MCARVITGCVRPTRTHDLRRVSGLPAIREVARHRAGMLYERIARLPDDAPAKKRLFELHQPRLKNRAFEAHHRAVREAEDRGDPPPAPPCDEAKEPYRQCWRRKATSIVTEAGLRGIPRTPILKHSGIAPWDLKGNLSNVAFSTEIEGLTGKRPSPQVRKELAERALRNMTGATIECWTDGSAKEGTHDGGGGALIVVGDEQRERKAPAGRYCSSYHAEMVAIDTALDEVLRSLPEREGETVRVFTDSRSAIQRLSGGPLNQTEQTAVDVWRKLLRVSEGRSVAFQWVPSHCGIARNEEADRIANEAARLDQSQAPIDLETAKAVIRRKTTTTTRRGRAATGSRKQRCIWNQIQADACPMWRKTLHRMGKADSPACTICDEDDDREHALLRCVRGTGVREQLFGLNPTLEEVMKWPDKSVRLLRASGRALRPVVE